MEISLKYVILRSQSGMSVPVIFSALLVHAEVASLLCKSRSLNENIGICKAVSAGFYDPSTGKVWGESETLKLKARGIDSAIIEEYSEKHGIGY